MFIERNCFERQTDNLGSNSIRTEVLTLYEISHSMANHQYQAALQQIQSHKQSLDFDDHSLKFQFKFMEAFCHYHLGDLQKTVQMVEEIYEDIDQQQRSILQQSYNSDTSKIGLYSELMRSFTVRFYTFVISIYAREVRVPMDMKELMQRLVDILKIDQYIYLPQVLGTLTGCKRFAEVRKVKTFPGEKNKRKAIKLQVLANWKYLIGQKALCIAFKREALQIWRKENSLKQKQKCQMELKQLLESQQQKGRFIAKLDRLKYLIEPLIQLQERVKDKPKPLQIKWYFPTLLSQLYFQQQEKKVLQSKSLTQSKFTKISQKKNQLNDVIQKCQQFYEDYREERNSEITALIYNSKFIDSNTKQMRRKLAIMFKIRLFYYRKIFPMIVKCAEQRSKKKKKN